MRLTLYRDATGFAALQADWNDLLHRSRTDTVFLTWEWQTTWWRHLGAGRGPLHLMAAHQDGRLAGILPLYGSAERTLQVVGCVEVSDYLDLIVEAGQEAAVYAALLAWLEGDEAPDWDVLDLCNQPDCSLAHRLLPEMARAAGHAAEVQLEDVAPVVALPAPCPPDDPACVDGWERYLDGLDKKERHEIRRKLRRMAREAPDAVFRTVTQDPGLPDALDDFIALHRNSSAEKRAFMTPEMEAYFRAIARSLVEHGWLRLSSLEIGGQAVASYFCIDYGNEILVYNSGYDPSAAPHLSPGWVLLSRLIQDAISAGRARLDFLQGNEDYKHRFGGVDTPVHRTFIRRAAR